MKKVTFFLFILFSLSIVMSCNKEIDDTYPQEIVDEYIQHLVKTSSNLLLLDNDDLLQAFLDIESVGLRKDLSFETFTYEIAQVLAVDKESVVSYLDFNSRHPEISKKESFILAVNKRFEILLLDGSIEIPASKGLDLRKCKWWEASIAVLQGATTLVSCGTYAGGFLPGCVGCGVGGYGAYNALSDCFF